MDRTLAYQNIILDLFDEYADYWQGNQGVDNHIIADKEQHRYSFVLVGWQDGKRYVHTIAFHLEIKNGKIWIHQNNTEAMIADELIERGVDKQDVILGFVPPKERIYTKFATT
jgi:hypothetical protein